MPTVNDNYPKNNSAELTDAQLKEFALQQHKQQEVKTSKFPTEIIELPSKGYFYPEGSALASGKEYEVEITDPFSPDDKQKLVIDLTEIKPKEYDFESIIPHQVEFEVSLPVSKRSLTFQLMTHGLEQKIRAEVKGNVKSAKSTGIDKELSTRMKYMITSVDGNRERSYINSFVENEFFAGDAKFVRDEIKKRTPDMDMTFTFISNVTGDSQEMEVPMDVSFFWPKS